MKKLWLIFLLMIPSVCGFGQNVDSLYTLYLDAKGDRRMALVNEMAQAAYETECTDTLFRVDHSVKPELTAAIVSELMASYTAYMLNDLARAVKFSLDAAQLYEQIDDISAMDVNYSNAAVYYFRMGDYEKAIDLMLKCYELELQMNDPYAISSTLNDLGLAYSIWGKSEVAMKYFRHAAEIERPLNRPMQYAGRLSMLAKENATLGNYEEALQLIQEALVYAQKIERNEREERIAIHQRIMGDIYDKMDSLPQSQKCYEHAVSVFEKNNRQPQLAESLLGLGRLQQRQLRFSEAIETLKYCISICEKNRLLRTLRDANRFLYEIYKQTGHTIQSLHYLEQYNNLNDSIFRETTQKQISEFQVKYEIAEKELELSRERLKTNQYKTRQFIYIGGLIALGLLLAMLEYMAIARTRRIRLLAELNATKDKFFSIISHDLKNPALSQRDAIQLLLENSRFWDPDLVAKYYAQLLKSANEHVDLLYSLLDWAQIQTGHMAYQPRLFDLVAALKSGVGFIKTMAEEKGVGLEVNMPASALVTADDNMLATVVRNLLINAVKFTAKGGKVRLEVLPCSEAEQNCSAAYTVSVSDTGVGMSAEQTQNLFRLDRQTSLQGTAGETGVGLGLIVCKEFIERHGSRLHVESQEGKGSRFWFPLSKN